MPDAIVEKMTPEEEALMRQFLDNPVVQKIVKNAPTLSIKDLDKKIGRSSTGKAIVGAVKVANKGKLNKFTEGATELIDALKSGSDVMGSHVGECPTVEPNSATEDKLISELQRIYNPVLVSQELNKSTSDVVLESVTADNVFTENNVIKFDNDTRKAQLISLCALLLARDANSPDYLAYKQAAKAKHALKLKIQDDYNAAAANLADRYLQSVATTSNSPIAKDAAENLQNVQ